MHTDQWAKVKAEGTDQMPVQTYASICQLQLSSIPAVKISAITVVSTLEQLSHVWFCMGQWVTKSLG